jgi:hypothetical protein
VFAQGTQIKQLSGIDTGHAKLLAWIDDWLAGLEEKTSR